MLPIVSDLSDEMPVDWAPAGVGGPIRAFGWIDPGALAKPARPPDINLIAYIKRAAPRYGQRSLFRCRMCTTARKIGPGEAAGSGVLLFDDVATGRVYVTHTLLPHFIEVHGYIPPAEVLAGIQQRTLIPRRGCLQRIVAWLRRHSVQRRVSRAGKTRP